MAPQRVLCRDTQLIIEGYPRCANSFAVSAFRMANDPEWKISIATHLHSPASIKFGIQRNIPVLLLIRKPKDCIVSWLSLSIQLGKLDFRSLDPRRRKALLNYWTRRYAQFYDVLLPYADCFPTVTFEQVTTDFGHCIDRLNEHYSTSFNRFNHTEANVSKIFQASKVHLSPSAERDEIKNMICEYYMSSKNEKLRDLAEATYDTFNKAALIDLD